MERKMKSASAVPETAARERRRLPKPVLGSILRVGLTAPCGPQGSALEFIVVQEKEMLQRMAGCRTDAEFAFSDAVCAIVAIGDEFTSDTIIEEATSALLRMSLVTVASGWGAMHIIGRLRVSTSGEPTEVFLRRLLGFPRAKRMCGILLIKANPAAKKRDATKDVLSENRERLYWGKYGAVRGTDYLKTLEDEEGEQL